MSAALAVLREVHGGRTVNDAIRRHPIPGGGYVGKHMLVEAYRNLIETGEFPEDPGLLAKIRMKPVRTLSGVTTVTVMTKPFPCPGNCIFCPTDLQMPKSYLPDEPGARRGLEHGYDPFGQVRDRLQALQSVGHPTDKVELLILGGTWSVYPKDYQEWFVKRCFDAMNGMEQESLEAAQACNENAVHRNVGLVIETRPDWIDAEELRWLRKLGATKLQIGVQSLDDQILKMNKRGHSAEQALQAVDLARAAGFKIVLHWMPNLLGADAASDRTDFSRLWQDYCPDEIKIYPTQLLENTELYQYWKRGEYQPYSTEKLVGLLADIKTTIPTYCRVNRVIRDIPSTHVVAGNKRTSLRQDVQAEMQRRGVRCSCIRCREIRNQRVDPAKLEFKDTIYTTRLAEEHFLAFETTDDRLAGFLRLSLPSKGSSSIQFKDLHQAAIIREVHIYGQSLAVGEENKQAAQHIGLGTELISQAARIASENGYPRLAVISAVGTRRYYEKLGFCRGELYMFKSVP